jgi:hypothetical protein
MCARYGHSLTACGPGHAWLLVFGGMTGGGYTGELNDVWVLRRTTPSPNSATDSTAELEWFRPPVAAGPGRVAPRRRGYHSAAASPDGRRVFIFGGISASDACDELAVLDTATWTWTLPLAAPGPGAAPGARFGCSATVFEGAMWLLGGGTGGDLLRDGVDLTDVWRLNIGADATADADAPPPALTTAAWERVQPGNAPPHAANLGRCHSAVRVGAKLVLFGGSKRTSSALSWFDMHTLAFGAPKIAMRVAPPHGAPCARFTHLAALLGRTMVLSCGWCYGGTAPRGCLGDVWRLELAPDAAVAASAVAQPTQGAGGYDDDADEDEGEEEQDDDEEEWLEDGASADEEEDDDAEDSEGDEAIGAEATYLATAAAAGAADEDAGDADGAGAAAVGVEANLVRALVLAMDDGHMGAVRRLLRRVHALRRQREGDVDDIDEM